MSSNTSLSKTHFALSEQWHPIKNGKLTSNNVSSGSKQKVWWLGKCGHEWESAINSRVAGRGCHYCSGYKVLPGFNDLATTHPEVLAEWHPTKNGNLSSSQVSAGSNRKVWWLGDCGHEFEVGIVNVVNGTGCYYCSGSRVLTGFNDIATTHPELACEWHLTKNEGLTVGQVSAGSNRKVWWLGECGHEWVMSCNSRVGGGQGCPVCAGKQILVGFNDLNTVSPLLIKEWDFNKNILKPQEVTAKSAKKVWWVCGKGGHSWEAVVYSRVNGNGCPACAGRVDSYYGLRGTVSWVELKPELVKEWSTKNGTVSPNSIPYGSKKLFWWECEKGHEWEASPLARIKNNTKCPICANKKVLKGFNDLGTVLPQLAMEWHPTKNKNLTSDQVTDGSGKRIWWECEKGHEWEVAVADRSRIRNLNNKTPLRSKCPKCMGHVSRGEKEIVLFFDELGLKSEKSNRTIISPLELDIYVPEKNIAVEFNGLYWHSEAAGKNKAYHNSKWKACKEKGIQLIQVWEDDWNNNPELVKRMLAHKLGVSITRKIFARKTSVTILNESVVKPFLMDNHLQGYRPAKYFGLVDKTNVNEVHPVAVIGVARKGENGLEIIRFATNAQVVGGFTKLLAHVLKQPEYAHVVKVYSYSHNDHSDGGMYENSGFILEHSGAPGYSYWKNGWPKRLNRLKYSPSRIKLNPNLIYEEGLNERELAVLNGITRVWDAGSSLWVKEL